MRRWWLGGVFLLLLACGLAEETATPSPAAEEDGGGSVTTATTNAPAGRETIQSLTVLYTNDEHGWMEGTEAGAGASELVGIWREREGYNPDDDAFLLLSGGDMWTGPAISTWFAGESMVEVMNTMGYAAAAVGNHEFDFGLDVLREHAAASTFPFVSANIRYAATGETPTDLGIQPFVVVEANGIQVGIIGLTTRRTPTTTKPDVVAPFTFIPYEEALREVVPRAKAAGAELILVPGHVCRAELELLARQIEDVGVHLLGGGHCNELFSSSAGDITLIGGGSSLSSYAYATIEFDTVSDTVTGVDSGVRINVGGSPDPVVAEVVRVWQGRAEQELNIVIGYSDSGIARRSEAMQDLITNAWLESYPADLAFTNLGGMRADFTPGDITIADVIGVMPFDNVIVEVSLTGSELETVLSGRQNNTAAAGLVYRRGDWIDVGTGAPLEPDRVYRVLINDFMFAGGDGYRFNEFDEVGYDTAINWRQPVIDWFESRPSSAANPIDDAIAALRP